MKPAAEPAAPRWWGCVLFAALCACAEPAVVAPPSAPEPSVAEAAEAGDAARGRRLMEARECSRCHQGTGLPEPPLERRCVGCHREISAGRFDAPEATLARWASRLHSLPDAPDLAGSRRLSREWLVTFLMSPSDQRPHLEATMPRLGIDRPDATDIAAALLERPPLDVRPLDDRRIETEAPLRMPILGTEGDLERGRRLLETRACGFCHLLGGTAILARGDPGVAGRARRLAPDLGLARARMRPDVLFAWLRAPASLHPATDMPDPGLSAAQAADVARYLLEVPLPTPPPPLLPQRLPRLDREVSYDEVEARVFRRVCWHCHSDPSYALGDGGPGNTGGFGFAGRGLDLASYQGLRSGSRDDAGARRSIFLEVGLPNGERLPLVVAVLRARQLEEVGRPVPGMTGMPLGLPSVSPEDLQLLETWIEQGRRR